MYSPQKLQLTVVDVSCTEAWLRLKTEGTEKAENENDWVLQVFRDDSLVVNKDWGAGDSLIYLDGLQPATAYAFSAKLLRDNKLLFSSPKVTATTLDTTSHDFTWQTFEFGGQGGSSSFYDVAIIDENDIWAVGEIYTADDKYNAAHWDGEKWELKKIDWDGYVSRLTCVFAFSSNDVWFGVTNLIHWDGNRFEKNINPVLNQFYSKTVNKIWGTSDNDLYIVGNEGLIAHYDGRQWQRIESGTDLRLLDIFGAINPAKNQKTILTVGANLFHGPETVVLQIKNNQSSEIDNTAFDKSIASVWSSNGIKWFLTGYDTFFSPKTLDDSFIKISQIPQNLKYRIRGSASNNIFITGAQGCIWHYNGKTWKDLSDKIGLYYAIAVTKELVVVVGNRPHNFLIGPARIKIGKRN